MSKVTLPVWYNEPLSLTQKGMDHSEHHLISEANHLDNSHMRCVYIAVFHYLNLAKNYNRTNKPFNALLGETYEYVKDDIKMMAE